jgi:murein DD-endopeptidase MepM/ murein hydrolase activator NlpD
LPWIFPKVEDMNLTPRATAVAVATLAGLIVGLAMLAPATADDRSALEQQRQGVAGQLEGARKAYDESSKAYAEANQKLARAQEKLGAAKNHLGQTRNQLSGAQAMDAKLRVQLEQAKSELLQAKAEAEKVQTKWERSRDLVAEGTVESLMRGDPGLEAFGELLNGEDPMVFAQRMSLTGSVADAQVATMQKLAADQVMLEVKTEQVKEFRDHVAVARVETAANVERTQELASQAEEQRDSVNQLVGSRKAAESEAARIRAEDERRLKELEQERQALEARIAAMVEAERQAAANGQGVGDGGGSLSAPIAGPITSRYGMRVHPITGVYKLHDGTDFGASCGTPVHAAAGGQIIDQYYNGGYGNRVILNNGVMNGHVIVTTYNHLTRFASSKGATINRGDVIGYVGSTGYSTGCHLHFMVLSDGHTTDPMGWL